MIRRSISNFIHVTCILGSYHKARIQKDYSSTKLEVPSKKGVNSVNFTDKWVKYAISLGIGFFLGLSIFFMVTTLYAPSLVEAEARGVVADCKASVLKYVPIGAYPEGSQQVIAALNYCGTLG